MRTLVLATGVLLVAAVGGFLLVNKWKHRINIKDLPTVLGINVIQEANGFTFTHAFGAHSQFKIHASKVMQLKNGHATLHDVKIELYGDDGSRVDRIEGAEFDYDQQAGTARAAGPVEITLMRPGVAPAIAPKAAPGAGESKADGKPSTLEVAEAKAAAGEIHVKADGVTFDQKSGIATTDQHVEFVLAQGMGSAVGARYDSQQGHLVLDHAVELNLRRGNAPIALHAQHAEFERDTMNSDLRGATADYQGGKATAGEAKILFREDGSAVRLDASGGFTLTSAAGSHVAAPEGNLIFDEQNHPRHGHMEGGVTMDSGSASPSGSRQLNGTAATAELEFTNQGELRHAHLERSVEFKTSEEGQEKDGLLRVSRTWHSPVADVELRETAKGQMEIASLHGMGGVTINAESQRGKAATLLSKLGADELSGEFGPASELHQMTGTGHASIDETTATGVRQTATGDRIEAHFAQAAGATPGHNANGPAGAGQIESAMLEGNVALVQIPALKPGGAAAQPLRAIAGRADYEGAGEWVHLTRAPRIENGGMQISADKLDISRASGDAFAHGNVKATWFGEPSSESAVGKSAPASNAGQTTAVLGGQGPTHVIAAEAEMQQATGAATFRGQARLWQQGNSIAAPVIVLNRQRQMLFAQGKDASDLVRVVLVSMAGTGAEAKGEKSAGAPAPSVIRVRGGEFTYSDIDRKALMRSASAGAVIAETAAATSISNEVEVFLKPAGAAENKTGGTRDALKQNNSAEVERMIARGHVTLTSQDRRGSGEQLVYTSQTGEYVLIGTAAAPPRMTDPARGTVTGEALIFHTRDDSVSIEGGGRKTTTETRTPK
jgi:lipopolysaccharide export system protein LptA